MDAIVQKDGNAGVEEEKRADHREGPV